MRRKIPYWLLVAIVASLFASALAVVVVFCNFPPTGIESLKDRADVVRNLGLVIGGIIALGIAVWRSKAAQDQVDVSERDRLDRRFRNGVELLSDKEVVSRLAGIRMLEQLAKHNAEGFRDDVTRVLCEFARNPTAIDKSDADARVAPPRLSVNEDTGVDEEHRQAAINDSRREEIEVAIRVVSDCNSAASDADRHTQLTLNLAGMSLYNADLRGVNLAGADFRQAQLVGVNFNGADLARANFTRAVLALADLQEARLVGANLSYVELGGANLLGIQIENSNFTGALLSRPTITDAGISAGADDELVATGLTQSLVDQMVAEDDNPPELRGVIDAETEEPLEWRH